MINRKKVSDRVALKYTCSLFWVVLNRERSVARMIVSEIGIFMFSFVCFRVD